MADYRPVTDLGKALQEIPDSISRLQARILRLESSIAGRGTLVDTAVASDTVRAADDGRSPASRANAKR